MILGDIIICSTAILQNSSFYVRKNAFEPDYIYHIFPNKHFPPTTLLISCWAELVIYACIVELLELWQPLQKGYTLYTGLERSVCPPIYPEASWERCSVRWRAPVLFSWDLKESIYTNEDLNYKYFLKSVFHFKGFQLPNTAVAFSRPLIHLRYAAHACH